LSLDVKNLAIIAHRFSHSSQGSLDFWALMNQRFSQLHDSGVPISIYDCSVIVHSFSLMKLLSKEKFMHITLQLFETNKTMDILPIDIG
jgi:hypothetical protein